MLFADRLLVGNLQIVAPPWTIESGPSMIRQSRACVDAVIGAIDDARVIVADNVSEYFYAGNDQDEWDLRRDFPSLAPPFPVTWVEWGNPTRIVMHGKPDITDLPMGRVGTLITATDISSSSEDDIKERAIRMRAMASNAADQSQVGAQVGAAKVASLTESQLQDMLRRVNDGMLAHGVRWVLNVIGLVMSDRIVMGPMVMATINVGRDGSYKPLNAQGNMPLGVFSDGASQNKYKEMINELHASYHPAYLTLSFLNCKNVTVQKHEPPAALSKAHKKRHGRLMLRYHMLEIEPMKTVLRTEGGTDAGHGLRHALHICRGHFKDYRASGLFGKNKGLYWWDHHVRGSSAHGVITKDYNIGKILTREDKT